MLNRMGNFPSALTIVFFAMIALMNVAAWSDQSNQYNKEILPLLQEYCYDCHGDGAKKGKLVLDAHSNPADIVADDELWEMVWENLHRRNMPPADKSQPKDEEIDRILSWIEKSVFDHDPEKTDPGHVVLRRLNRVEYKNTIRDLFGVNIETESLFPADDTGHGFDTIGEVLTLSPLLMEKYMDAADLVLEKTFGGGDASLAELTFTGPMIRGGTSSGEVRVLPSSGLFSVTPAIPSSGNYMVEIEASASRAGKGFAEMGVRIGRKFSQTIEVKAEYPSFKTYRFEQVLEKTAGLEIRASFLNDFYDPRNKDPKRRDRNLFVRKISIVPQDVLSQDCVLRRKKLLGGQNDKDFSSEKVRLVLEKLLPRIYRFPLSESELSRHVDLFEASRNEKAGNFEALRVVLKAALVSPRFLFREEARPSASDLPKVYPLDDFALANRLSYFLWSSLPDEALWQKAKSGTLRGNLDMEVRRMVADPKTDAFIANFTGQWLQLRDLEMSNPDRRRFPSFTDDLRSAMRKETEYFFGYLLRENRPVSEFLTADYTFSNQKLANYYKFEGKFENEFRKVFLNGINRKQRGGLLSHSSILTITSNPTRTSPVKRGRWVLDNLLGAPPKDPPPGVPELEEAFAGHNEKLTLREQLAKHSRKAECSSCHANMDAMGFALENYDAIGKWRISERGQPIDSIGKLATGESFSGPMELQEFIAEKKLSAFTRCLTEKLLTYGIGRGMEYYDRASIEKIAQNVSQKGKGLKDLIVEVVVSTPFTCADERSASSLVD
jgi:mono/diheme cytochrome c family protein